ncbi:MAG: DNA polymerase III [Bdellovibrionales bacterium GWA1_52_35]|nr:MAG: DNA polymerase III [Bdellovibrionales bacterium GWA1_52_35]HCM39219.1 DNA polymerase/3'-5' exonuclease PolX [Bdellovibrionales bacterium]
MPVPNSYIGQIFSQLADLLEIEGANQFRVRAYRNAAQIVSQWPRSLAEIIARGDELPKIAGLGKDLSGKVTEIATTGNCSLLQEIEKRIPGQLSTLLKIPGLGPKRVLLLRDCLRIENLRDLKRAAQEGKIRELPGLGPKIERVILRELRKPQVELPGSGEAPEKRRMPRQTAEQIIHPLLHWLENVLDVKRLIVAGSYRRGQETVGDLDLLATCDSPLSAADSIMERFIQYEEVASVLARGRTKTSVWLRSGIQVDLRVIPEESYGAALHYFTGSKSHNIAVRALGVKKGLKINEYGVYRGSRRIAGSTEEQVYRAVGLPYIEPELREQKGEIEAAFEDHLPSLVTLQDIRGDLHAHTLATDGRATIEELAEAALRKGYQYLSITDHTRHLTVAKGLDPGRLLEQIRKIDQINEKLGDLRVLKSSEVDILENGSLDLPDEILRELDITVCSVHYKFNLSREKQTERIIRAMDNPYFNILAHATGRLIGRRPPYEIDMERLMLAARERHCFFELNSQPDRLDLNEHHCRLAKELGVKVAISTDAHHVSELEFMRYGVTQARRGWLEPENILNTRSWPELQRLLFSKRSYSPLSRDHPQNSRDSLRKHMQSGRHRVPNSDS